MAATSINSYVPTNATPMQDAPREYPKKLVIRSQNRIFLQTVADIDYLSAAANYVHIHAAGQVSRIRSTINTIEHRLDPEKFGRVHRCTIVNFDRVTEFRPLQRGDYLLVLNDGSQVKMSRRHRAQLDKIIGQACATGRHLVKYAGAGEQQSSLAPTIARSGRGPSVS